MNLGNNLFGARKKSGLSQEEVAEKLGVSRQTISKWELGETLPDIQQSKRLSLLYHLSLDELIDFDLDVQEIQEVIDKTSEEVNEKVDCTKAWGKKYPVLVTYQEKIDKSAYAKGLEALLDDLQKKYSYNKMDSFLVLKDIMATVWKARKDSAK